MATTSAPLLPAVPVTDEGITCGLCTASIGMEIKHADAEDVATCSWIRWETLHITRDEDIPAWLA
jgi:hypothetical protein